MVVLTGTHHPYGQRRQLVRTAGRAGRGPIVSGTVVRFGATGPEMCGDGAGVLVEDSETDRKGSLMAS